MEDWLSVAVMELFLLYLGCEKMFLSIDDVI